MYKKTIKYVDYDGNEREEDFYFNLNKAELLNMDFSSDGSLEAYINKIVKEQDKKSLIKLFQDIILMSYGEKSLDGKHFKKSKEITDDFVSTEAYSNLYIELATNSKAAADFVNGIIPSDIAAGLDTSSILSIEGSNA